MGAWVEAERTGVRFTHRDLNIPSFPEKGCDVRDNAPASGWFPGFKTDLAPNMLIRADQWDTKRYYKFGGSQESHVAHLLGDDVIIEPLWDGENLAKKILLYRELGIKSIVSPDFSTWYQLPLIVQFYQVYRSAVLSVDLSRAGFRIIPNIKIGCMPEHFDVYTGWWPEKLTCPVIIDAAHLANATELGHTTFWRNAKTFREKWPNTYVWLYSRTRRYAEQWLNHVGPCCWVPSRCFLQYEMQTIRAARNKKSTIASTKRK